MNVTLGIKHSTFKNDQLKINTRTMHSLGYTNRLIDAIQISDQFSSN